MPRFVKLLSTQVLEDELMLLHTCAMLSQASFIIIIIIIVLLLLLYCSARQKLCRFISATGTHTDLLLTLISQHPKNHVQMVRDGILARIFTVLRSPMKSVKHKHYACVTLSEVCLPLDNHRQICEEGGLNAMVALCGHFHEDVRSFAAIAVERLGENSSLRRPLVEAGVVPPLVAMLGAKKLFSQRSSALALGSLAQVRALCALLPPVPSSSCNLCAGSSQSDKDCAAGRARCSDEAVALWSGRARGYRHANTWAISAEQHQPAENALHRRLQASRVQRAVRRIGGEQNELEECAVWSVQDRRAQAG
jgi:hypothetical protein